MFHAAEAVVGQRSLILSHPKPEGGPGGSESLGIYDTRMLVA